MDISDAVAVHLIKLGEDNEYDDEYYNDHLNLIQITYLNQV